MQRELGRRELGKLLAASLALAGLGACGRRPRERIFPYVTRPPGVVPGNRTHYATSMLTDGFAVGVLGESREGRPVKIGGNPEHPASLGAAGALEQASILSLYAPERARVARSPRGLEPVDSMLAELASACRRGPPPWLVLGPESSPSLAGALAELEARLPGVRVAFHAPLDRTPIYAASRAFYGRALDAQHRFDEADVIFALGADFTARMPMSLRYARDFSLRRRPNGALPMSRLYVAETALSPTGSVADQRVALRPSALVRLAADVLAAVARHPALGGRLPAGLASALSRAEPAAEPSFVASVAHDLVTAERPVVLAGPAQPYDVQLLALALNALLDARASFLTAPALLAPAGERELAELARTPPAELGAVVLAGTNPVYTAPELGLGALLERVPASFCLAEVEHETARACRYVVPEAHYLETWGDARAYDGTWSLIQPLIEPRFQALTVLELVARIARQAPVSAFELVRAAHARELGASAASGEAALRAWEGDVQRGFVEGSAAAPVAAAPVWAEVVSVHERVLARTAPAPLEISWQQAPHLDVRCTPNPWLLELPHPLTKQCWGNAAVLAPATARALGADSGDVLALTVDGRSVELPALVLPGHAEGAVTLELGLGHEAPGLPSYEVGVNALQLGSGGRHGGAVLAARVSGRRETLARTQEFDAPARGSEPLTMTLAALARRTGASPAQVDERRARRSLFVAPPTTGRQWAMTIDTTLCTGCSACVVACQAENNVPVVGKLGVERSREMHWLRIDRYFTSERGGPRVVHQPMLCQHCEKAPCEAVCPVNATVHSPDGLNEMVYNRCIGTRFCSNNCPYKVRRFNWFDFSAPRGPEVLARNPDVTVRERGVMEKCTYCVQRIRRAEVQARAEQRAIRQGEVRTACQETCPTRAIEFGSLDEPESEMVRRRNEPQAYDVLAELGTRPRTRYLAKIVNPAPGSET